MGDEVASGDGRKVVAGTMDNTGSQHDDAAGWAGDGMACFIPWMLLLLPSVELLVVPMLAAADDSGGALFCLHAVQADENAKLATGVCGAVAVGPVPMPIAGAATVGSTDGGIAEVADAFSVQESLGHATATLIKDYPTQDGAV